MTDSRRLPRAVISLDFELRWGVHDVYGTDFSGYRENLSRVREIVPALLERFSAHALPATWAAVGAIGCASWDEYFERAPQPPKYANEKLRIQPEYAKLDPRGELHFAPDLLQAIASTPGQELGTHTFSHLYLREPGITAGDVAADLAAVARLYTHRFGHRPTSLVFPRNQAAFIDVIRACGITMWRGNPGPWYYECEDTEHNGLLPRALKLADGLNPLRRLASPLAGDMTRASLFLRLNLPDYLWQAHFSKIEREVDTLRGDDVFHLWFHPHNLGQDMALRLSRLESVVALLAERRERGALRVCSMGDLAGAGRRFSARREPESSSA